jgi:hypothetical protein
VPLELVLQVVHGYSLAPLLRSKKLIWSLGELESKVSSNVSFAQERTIIITNRFPNL